MHETAFDGHYSDGLTARRHAVHVTANVAGLAFDADGAAIIWSWHEVRVIDRAAGRLGNASVPDARLDVPSAALDTLVHHAPHLSAAAGQKGHLRLVAGLVAAGAATAALVFFGIPAAAVPLAKITPASFEEQLGRSVEAQLDLPLTICKGEGASTGGADALQDVATRLADQADLRFPITVRVIDTPIINALALPGGKVWVTRGLIEKAGTPDEVAAVIAHEIAHVENRDVLVSLYRVMGFGLILDAVLGGGTGAGQQIIMLGANLADTRHSRDVEARADARGMELLHEAGLDSRGMAAFFDRLSNLEPKGALGDWMELVSTHPSSAGRREQARAAARSGEPALTASEWAAVRQVCNTKGP
jgi:beta-barrel assembly-enhancing protease